MNALFAKLDRRRALRSATAFQGGDYRCGGWFVRLWIHHEDEICREPRSTVRSVSYSFNIARSQADLEDAPLIDYEDIRELMLLLRGGLHITDTECPWTPEDTEWDFDPEQHGFQKLEPLKARHTAGGSS